MLQCMHQTNSYSVDSKKTLPCSTYYKHMIYYKPTRFSSKFSIGVYGIFVYKLRTYYKPTLFRADVRRSHMGL